MEIVDGIKYLGDVNNSITCAYIMNLFVKDGENPKIIEFLNPKKS